MSYTMTGQSPLSRICQDIYTSIKAQHSTEGRRKWRLRVAEHFWKLDPETKLLLSAAQIGVGVLWENADFVTDSDPLDESTSNIPEIGILVRTDYTDEDAWLAFHAKLKGAEKELASEVISDGDKMAEDEPAHEAQNKPSQATGSGTHGVAMQEDEESSSDDDGIDAVFKIINPQSSEEHAQFTSISNLSALRLLNDMDIRLAPTPPAGAKRIKPPNRLVDFDGWQEVYSGKTLWIYDAKSNEDQCVRMVSQQGDMYGTATGDSWRARVGHICELQVNLHYGGMKIDFGGLDRWDYSERHRNMQEANWSIK